MEKVWIIALNTYRESIRSKILYSTFFFAGLIVLVTTIFGSVTIGDQVKVIKDFGLMSISLFSVGYIVIAGATLLEKELAKKTIFNLLAKPVRRGEFVLGKWLGLLMTSLLLAFTMTVALVGYVALFEGGVDSLLLLSGLFIVLELAIVSATAIFFSSLVVTPLLNGLFTFAVFLVGRNVEYVSYFVKTGEVEGLSKVVLDLLYFILPHLDKLNFHNSIVYGVPVPSGLILNAVLYTAGYAGVLMVLANFLFKRREFA